MQLGKKSRPDKPFATIPRPQLLVMFACSAAMLMWQKEDKAEVLVDVEDGNRPRKNKQANIFLLPLYSSRVYKRMWSISIQQSGFGVLFREPHAIKTQNDINHRICHRNINNGMHLSELWPTSYSSSLRLQKIGKRNSPPFNTVLGS